MSEETLNNIIYSDLLKNFDAQNLEYKPQKHNSFCFVLLLKFMDEDELLVKILEYK